MKPEVANLDGGRDGLKSVTGPTRVEGGSLNSSTEGEERTLERVKWTSQTEFILSCVGYAVGLTNIWRFPYLCMRNGGGAFLIPYFLSLFLCGMPLFFMEMVIGQFSSKSPLQIWSICPLFTGLGYGMVILSSIVCVYYNIIISWALFFLFKSFAKSLPWATCGNSWNTPLCLVRAVLEMNETVLFDNSTVDNYNRTQPSYENWGREEMARLYLNVSANESIPWKSPTEEYWEHELLQLTDGIHSLGGIKWDLMACFLLSWVIVFLCLCRGIKTSGKVVYVTATAPYLFLTILLVRGCMLPGAIDGIKYYVIPDWKKLLDFNVWAEAMMQIFYTLGPGWGGVITLASFNRFNNNVIRDGVMIPIVTCLSSFYGGFAIFSVIGFMAHKANLHVSEVVTSGPGLAFIAYPEALSKLPFSPIWSILFFTMFLTVGLDTQFGMFETMSSSVVDQFPKYLRKHKLLFTSVVCILEFLIGIPLVTRGGMYVFQILDWYVAYSVMFIAVFECVALSWAYGMERLYYDIELMTGSRPSIFWKICWGFVTPILLVIIIIYSCATIQRPSYGDYEYPSWAITLGWLVSMCSFVPIPVFFVIVLLSYKGSFFTRLKQSLQPSDEWEPSDVRAKYQYNYKRTSYKFTLLRQKQTDSRDVQLCKVDCNNA